jgi:lipopolysaccharide export system protein LptA
MRTRRSITIAAWCLLLPVALWITLTTDNTLSAEIKKTILEHADRIEGGENPGPSGTTIPYRSAVGNVKFLHGETTLQCDRATDWPDSERIDLEGHIIIKDKTLETRSDTGVYHTDRESGELTGNVRGRVLDDSLSAKSKRGVFDRNKNELWLFDDAVAWQRGRQLSGDSIRVHVREIAGKKRVDEIQVFGHAFLAVPDTLSSSPVLHDQLSGKQLTANLDDRSRLQKVVATKNAKSLYHIYDDKNQPSGVNFTSGDRIRMFFVEGKLDRILVTRGALGKEYPNRMRNAPEINLPGFRLRDKEKPVFSP